MKYLKVFDKTRLQILGKLYTCRDNVCGCDIVKDFDIPKSLLSYHMKILNEEGLVEETRCGNKKIYTITKAKSKDVLKILNAVHFN